MLTPHKCLWERKGLERGIFRHVPYTSICSLPLCLVKSVFVSQNGPEVIEPELHLHRAPHLVEGTSALPVPPRPGRGCVLISTLGLRIFLAEALFVEIQSTAGHCTDSESGKNLIFNLSFFSCCPVGCFCNLCC